MKRKMPKVRAVAPFKSAYNAFNWGHPFDLSFKFGIAYPVLVLPYSPGTSLDINWEQLSRMVPLNNPAFTKVRMRLDAFRCDHHTVWPNFEKYVMQTGDEETPIEAPYVVVPSGGFAKGSLPDYLGFGIGTGDGDHIDALIFRHIVNIKNNYYINSNVQEETEFSTGDGLDNTTPVSLFHINYRQDRFVGAEISTQKGSATILPIASSAPVSVFGNGNALALTTGSSTDPTYLGGTHYLYETSDNAVTGNSTGVTGPVAAGTNADSYGGFENHKLLGLSPNPTVSGIVGEADLSKVAGVDLNMLTTAERLNQYKIMSLLAGNHYPDWQNVMYGVPSSDARLQIPEWLGSYKAPFVITEVLQTSQTTESSVQGTMTGHGFSASSGHLYVPRLNAHGYIIIMMTVMPSITYDQGLPEMYNRFSPFDYINPMFAKMPMQPIKNSALYWQSNSVVDDDGVPVNDNTFAFSPIYDAERTRLGHVAGDFHDSYANMIVRRHFDACPSYNEDFITVSDDIGSDIFADTTHDYLYGHFDWHIIAIQKLPKVGLQKFI